MRKILGITLVLSSITAFSAENLDDCFQENEKRCIAVVDAGSTGTRLHLYSYELDSSKMPVSITRLMPVQKKSPGLADISLDNNRYTSDYQ